MCLRVTFPRAKQPLAIREDDHLVRGTDECVSVGGVLLRLGKINNKLHYHWIHFFLPFHWPTANHMPGNKCPQIMVCL